MNDIDEQLNSLPKVIHTAYRNKNIKSSLTERFYSSPWGNHIKAILFILPRTHERTRV